MKVVFLDVEQGDSTLVMLDDGTSILVDCNFTDEHITKIKGYLSKSKLSPDVIDALFITHPHEDHIRGIGKLYEKFEINSIYESGHRLYISDEKKSPHYKDMINIFQKMKNNGKTCKQLKAYEKFNVGSAIIEVFSPTKAYLADEKPQERDIHDQCLVFRLEENGVSILFAGDSSMSAWKERIVPYYGGFNNKKNLLQSTLLSASHHGSNTFFYPTSKADGEPYLWGIKKINPIITVISAAEANKHGLPDRKALELYKKYTHGIPNNVYQTRWYKDIIVQTKSNGNFQLFTEDFLERCYFKDLEDTYATIISSPPPDVNGFYKKNVNIEFQVKVNKYPKGHPAGEIRWSVLNNSVLPDVNHDFYEGQKSMNFIYKNRTAYLGEHYLLCEVRDAHNRNICTTYIKVKVK